MLENKKKIYLKKITMKKLIVFVKCFVILLSGNVHAGFFDNIINHIEKGNIEGFITEIVDEASKEVDSQNAEDQEIELPKIESDLFGSTIKEFLEVNQDDNSKNLNKKYSSEKIRIDALDKGFIIDTDLENGLIVDANYEQTEEHESTYIASHLDRQNIETLILLSQQELVDKFNSKFLSAYENLDEDLDGVPDHLDMFPFQATKSNNIFEESKESALNGFNNLNDGYGLHDGNTVHEVVGSVPVQIKGLLFGTKGNKDEDYFSLDLDPKKVTFVIRAHNKILPKLSLINKDGNDIFLEKIDIANTNNLVFYSAYIKNKGEYFISFNDVRLMMNRDWNYRIDVFYDSDSDGMSDIVEEALGMDTTTHDTDQDQVSDYVEYAALAPNWHKLIDLDRDNIPTWFDIDSDGDGISDMAENALSLDANQWGVLNDPDNDLLLNFVDQDSDGNGILDSVELENDNGKLLDFDKDGIYNHIDMDDDGDGLPDKFELGSKMKDPLPLPLEENSLMIRYSKNEDLNIVDVCIEGGRINIHASNIPESINDIFGTFSGYPPVNPISINSYEGLMTFICPKMVGDGNTFLFKLATFNNQTNPLYIINLKNSKPIINNVVFDTDLKIMSIMGKNLKQNFTVKINGLSFKRDNLGGLDTKISIPFIKGEYKGVMELLTNEGVSDSVYIDVPTKITAKIVNNVSSSIEIKDNKINGKEIYFNKNLIKDFNRFTFDVQHSPYQILTLEFLNQNGEYEDYLSTVLFAGDETVEFSAMSNIIATIWPNISKEITQNQHLQRVYLEVIPKLPRVASFVESNYFVLFEPGNKDPLSIEFFNDIGATINENSLSLDLPTEIK